MKQLLYFIVFLLLAPLLLAFWAEGLAALGSVIDSPVLLWFELGILASILLGFVLSGAVTSFIQVAVHELTHAAVGLLFLGRVSYMEAKSSGGGVTRLDTGHNPLVALAPYYFPLLAVPFLLAKPILRGTGETASNVLDFLLGLALGFHYVMHIVQFRFYQSDLKSTGYVVSIGMTYTLMLVFLVVTVSVVLGQYGSIPDYFAKAVERAPTYYSIALEWLRRIELPT